LVPAFVPALLPAQLEWDLAQDEELSLLTTMEVNPALFLAARLTQATFAAEERNVRDSN
jgi:hypothetical protein